MKKGQITIFIILGLILLVIFSFIFYIKIMPIISTEDFPEVKNYIDSCLSFSSKKAIHYIALKGSMPGTETFIQGTAIPLFKTPPADTENYIQKDVESRFAQCISKNPLPGISIKVKDPRIKVSINPSDILITIISPIRVSKGMHVKVFKEISDSEDAKLGQILSIVNNSMTTMKGDSFNLTLLRSSPFRIDIFKYKDGVIFDIKDDSYMLDDEPLEFVYAVETE